MTPFDRGQPTAGLDEQALVICNHSTGSSEPRQVRRLAPAQAKRYMLENMSSLKVKGALASSLRPTRSRGVVSY